MRTINEWMDLTRNLALQVMELTDHIPFRTSDNEIVKQITRSSNSVASNFRATRRAKSKADFLNKYKIVEEEADETIHFLFILKARFPALESSIVELTKAYEEFLAIVVKSIQSIRKSRNKQQ